MNLEKNIKMFSRGLIIKASLLLVICACSRKSVNDPVKFIYNREYKDHAYSIMLEDLIKTKNDARLVALTYFKMYFEKYSIFEEFYSLKITLNEDKNIWKISLFTNEVLRNSNVESKIKYEVYIKKENGALLYIKRKTPHWQ